jgi:hypothetical protein
VLQSQWSCPAVAFALWIVAWCRLAVLRFEWPVFICQSNVWGPGAGLRSDVRGPLGPRPRGPAGGHGLDDVR